MPRVPRDHPVRPLRYGSKAFRDAERRRELAQCGTCERYWDDGKPTSMTPVPSGRCPFEYYHPEPRRSPPLQGNSAARRASAIDPHVAIIAAAKRGESLVLSARQVAHLARDDAIRQRAQEVRDGTARETFSTLG